MQKTHQFVVDKKGVKTAIILDIHEYETMLEDLHDLRIFEERKNDTVVSFEKFDSQMKAHAKLSNRSKK